MLAPLHGTAVADQAGIASSLDDLDENVREHISRAAQTVGALAPWASTSKQLCRLSRSGTAYSLHVMDQEQAMLLLSCQAFGRPAFSGCTQLYLQAADMPACSTMLYIMGVAQQWPALQQLQLSMKGVLHQLQPGSLLDNTTPATLSGLRGLRHLRSLHLAVPRFNAASAGHVGQLKQLTALTLAVSYAAADARVDLRALSGLRTLKQLSLDWPPAVEPAAGPEGPFCLPSSLTALHIDQMDEQHVEEEWDAAPMACWLTHLPGAPQLQELRLTYGAHSDQHASAYPNNVVRLLAQHNQQLRVLHLVDGPWDADVWAVPVEGLPDVDADQPYECCFKALAQLTGLEQLRAWEILQVHTQERWQQLAALTALTEMQDGMLGSAPQQQAGITLGLLSMQNCVVHLGGHDLGLLLLACPVLRQANISIGPGIIVAAAVPHAATPLQQHTRLQQLTLHDCVCWRDAAAHFAAVAPVVSGVRELQLDGPLEAFSFSVDETLADLCAWATQLAALSLG